MENTLSQDQVQDLLAALARPFDLKEVKWVVKSTTQDQKKALVSAYCDPRSYFTRLNNVLSASGWGNEYKTEIVTGLTRMLKGKPVQTGKVSTICQLSIFAVGATKSSTGEQWADDDNAVTRAEAQSFKRAAAMFGLGAYFYAIKNGVDGINLWVPYDAQKRQITQSPRLPDWALNETDLEARNNNRPQQRPPQGQSPNISTQGQQPRHENGPQQGPRQAQQTEQQQQPKGNPQQGPQIQQCAQQHSPATATEARKKEHVVNLGQPLYASIVAEVNRRADSGELKRDKFIFLENMLVLKGKQLSAVREAAAEMPPGALDGLLDRHGVKRLDLVPSFAILNSLADDLGSDLKKAA